MKTSSGHGPLLCLGIESSCDETGLALYQADGQTEGQGKLLGSVLSSQADIHALFGGVVPELASREHYRLIGKLYDLLLKKTGVNSQDINLVAVARGPGLLGALLVGLTFAKGLCLGNGAKLLGVNHLEAHLLACGLEQPLIFPALGLLVSGGHTHIYRMDSPQHFVLLGRTLDDAAGEAFDKVAKMLHLPYPGGKWLDMLGQRGQINPRLFPKPYLDNDNLDFSFSGLKTALSSYISKHLGLLRSPSCPASLPTSCSISWPLNWEAKEANPLLTELAASFNHSVAATLSSKLERALLRETVAPESAPKDPPKVSSDSSYGVLPELSPEPIRAIYLAGGVACNSLVSRYLKELATKFNLPLLIPSPGLCTDNASMIAYTGALLGAAGLSHGLDLGAVPKGRMIPKDYLVS